MRPYPHTYIASATGDPSGSVAVDAPQLARFETAPPPEFNGPGGLWSPEALLCASLADCFIFTFRAESRAAGLQWLHLDCRVEGQLERVDRQSQFTRFAIYANLVVPSTTDVTKAHKLLEQAEHSCPIGNSVRGARTLEAHVQPVHDRPS